MLGLGRVGGWPWSVGYFMRHHRHGSLGRRRGERISQGRRITADEALRPFSLLKNIDEGMNAKKTPLGVRILASKLELMNAFNSGKAVQLVTVLCGLALAAFVLTGCKGIPTQGERAARQDLKTV